MTARIALRTTPPSVLEARQTRIKRVVSERFSSALMIRSGLKVIPPAMKQPIGVLTIVSKNYLAFARTLMASVRQHQPDALRFVVLVDDVAGEFEPDKEDFVVIQSDILDIPDSGWFHFKYSVLELNTAVKPYALEYVFRNHDVDRLYYFDPDILLLTSLSELNAFLNESEIVLTPHLTQPLPEDGKRPDELDILRAGAYNLGFIGIRKGDNVSRFLKWWETKLYDHCYVDLNRGLFTDQKWIDLVPGLFPRVRIVRSPAYNAAYWNLSHRAVTRVDEQYTVNGSVLCFFHFSGFDPLRPEPLSKHQNRFTVSDVPDVKELALDYASRVIVNGLERCRQWTYAYASFRNGEPVADYCRRSWAESGQLAGIDDPFSTAAFAEYFAYWTAIVEPEHVPRIAYDIYTKRPDLQRAYPDLAGAHKTGFLNWFVDTAGSEYRLPDHFLLYVRKLLRADNKRASNHAGFTPQEIGSPALRNSLLSFMKQLQDVPDGEDLTDWLAEHTFENGVSLPRIAHIVYNDRDDLKKAFPDLSGSDGGRFLAWMLTYGQREYGFQPRVIATLEEHLTRFNLISRVAGVQFPLQLASRILSRRRSGTSASASLRTMSFSVDQTDAADIPEGLNIVGYLRSHTGVGQAGRSTIDAARAARIPASVNIFEVGDLSGKSEYGDNTEMHAGFCYDINLFNVNADQTPALLSHLDTSQYVTRYNIGYWNWELENMPDEYAQSFSLLDEVWAPTAFCQDSFSRRSPIPVIRMPYAVDVSVDPAITRASLSLPPNDFLFLTMFDVLSIVPRKNPEAVIRAFRELQRDSPGCRLVLKINNADRMPAAVTKLREACEGLNVVIIDYSMSRADVNGLIAACDCLVSLHRSEGYGFALAEAMHLGKPVIATAYSGNMDFTTHDNSFLVGYKLTRVGPGCAPYPPDSYWAEPDTGEAIAQMRTVRSQPDIARKVAVKGQGFVREHLSPVRVGERMAERLRQIRSQSRRCTPAAHVCRSAGR